MRKIARRAAIGIIQFYRGGISPYLPPHCRYTPTCSSYAIEAINRFGIVRGAWLAVKRISRCHPWHDGGYDPVPDAAQHAKQLDTNINHKH